MERLGNKACILALVGLSLSLGGKAYAQTDHSLDEDQITGGVQERDAHDRKFLKAALEGESVQVQMGQLALQKCSDDRVKQFAQEVIDDQGGLSAELKPMASKLGVKPSDKPARRDRSDLSKLSSLSGGECDVAYLKIVVQDAKSGQWNDHDEMNSGQDGNVKAAAAEETDLFNKEMETAKQIGKAENITEW